MIKGYETYFLRSQNPSIGAHNYIDYGLHKDLLRKFYARRQQLAKALREGGGKVAAEALNDIAGEPLAEEESAGCNAAACGFHDVKVVERDDARLRLTLLERREFEASLEHHVSAAAIYWSKELLPEAERLADSNEYDAASMQLLEAVAFACTNVITFRQLLIRYDAFRRTFDGLPLSEWHLTRSVLDVDHPFSALFRLEGVDELEKRIVLGMQERGQQSDGTGEEDGVLVGKDGTKNLSGAEELTKQVQAFAYLLDKTDSSLEKAVEGHMVGKDRALSYVMRMRQYLLFGFGPRSDGLIDGPKSTSMRGRHFKREIKIIGKWRRTKDFAHFSIQDDQDRGEFKKRLKEVSPENVFPLVLNLISCFMHMMNNYIVEPSSAHYASALGSSDALAGLVLGMAPWFALVSAVGYSFWTNRNYKYPILCAGFLQMFGNLLYANAYTHKSMEMCLFGRAIVGLGAPRVINRRYVADATPFSLRTTASAAFMMATALGAAMGPGISIVLDRMKPYDFYIPFLGEQHFNGMTGPGYFMAFNWFWFTLLILFFFNEPTRSGLEELRKREEEAGGGSGKARKATEDSKKESLLNEVELAAIQSDKDKVAEAEVGAGANEDGLPDSEQAESFESFDDDLSLDRQDSLSLEGEEYIDDTSLNLSETSPQNALGIREEEDKPESLGDRYCYCVKNITRPVIICMSLIFMKRIALESVVGSTSIITKNRYGWAVDNVGTLHLINGIIVIPVSFYSGYLSIKYEDRYLAVWTLAITLFGMAFLFDPTDVVNFEDTETFNEGHVWAVGQVKYIIGSLIAFSGIEACESYVASLMSKVVPSALAQGTMNSGLLATLVGTGGRAVGDLVITLMGLVSIRNLLNLLIVPGAALTAFSIWLIRWNWDILGV
ncbi:hypothetical protein ACHAWF_006314 [Thalassiosira exigua]